MSVSPGAKESLFTGGLSSEGPSEADEELVTVVIPARNEERFIGPCLDSVLSQTYRNLQVIVVDGASRDRTGEILRRRAADDSRIEALENPEANIPKSLNLALAAAAGQWFVRVDAHARIPATYVAAAVRHLRTGRWGGVGGRKDGVGVTSAGRAIAAAMSSRFGVGNSTYHYGTEIQAVEHIPFGAYPTGLLRNLGGWDERLLVNQDFELDYRVRLSGRALLFDPQLIILWHCRQSVPDLFRQYRRYGRGKTVVGRLHPGSLRSRHLLAPVLVAWLAGAGLVAIRHPGLGTAALSPYVVALGVASLATAPKVTGRSARAWLPLAFLAMHVGWGVGFWEGLVRSGKALDGASPTEMAIPISVGTDAARGDEGEQSA